MPAVNTYSAVKARTLEPNQNGYLILAAEIDWRGPFRRDRRHKRRLIALARDWCAHLATRPDVIEANVFRAVLVAPGEGTEPIKAREDKVHRARYDVVVLIRTPSIAAARRLREDYEYRALANTIHVSAKYVTEVVRADNGIINRASWPSFFAFLPRLIFRPSFRSFVLANFTANQIAAQLMLYRRVSPSAAT